MGKMKELFLEYQQQMTGSNADMLDDELKTAIAAEMPKNIPHVFISSVTGYQLQILKDLLWKTLNTIHDI